MCDKLVFDLSQEVEGSPSVFVRKDWINILDNQNQSYVANQSVLDTSQLSNSNKYMSYREAYLSIPLLLTMTSSGPVSLVNATVTPTVDLFTPATEETSSDASIGLKNWFGNIIHSFTCDYNGSTIIQQTPFVNMWNSFKLMTSLSYNDIITQGSTIGFYPDNPESFEYYQVVDPTNNDEIVYPGAGVCNNTNAKSLACELGDRFSRLQSGLGNDGFIQRQRWINFDGSGVAQGNLANTSGSTYASLLSGGQVGASGSIQAFNQLWKSYIFNKQNQTSSLAGVLQIAVVATVYLKHVHSFFNMIPLLKGVFIKMTMNLNNCSSSVIVGNSVLAPNTTALAATCNYQVCSRTQSALGGSNMLMFASNYLDEKTNQENGSANLEPLATNATLTPTAAGITAVNKTYLLSVSVGAVCLDSQQANLSGVQASPLSRSIYLYIPAYTFNPTFEQAYISSPVKQIKYTDIYQYQVLGVDPNGGNFNNLLTNGIANVKSVLILPFYSVTPKESTLFRSANVSISNNTGFLAGVPVWQSPFDVAGCGATSPLCHFTNFNVQVSGQNAIYNLQKYTFEQFNNQLYGQNAVNGGCTDGLTSGLIDRQAFDLEYCYYYVNIERMLPVEQSVPKSIQILGQNMSSKAVDLYCFIEYGTEVNIDVLTGARV